MNKLLVMSRRYKDLMPLGRDLISWLLVVTLMVLWIGGNKGILPRILVVSLAIVDY